MQEWFSRTELLLGKEALNKLNGSRVAVFGIGGVGGYAVEGLVRAGIGAVDLIDGDKVSLTNINRQIVATRKTMGMYKVDVAAERALDINPDVKITVYRSFYSGERALDFDFSKYDYIIDAVDDVDAKISLVLQAQNAGTPIISSMGAGNKLDPTAFEVADIYNTSVCPLARVMRRELKRRGVKSLKVVFSKETPVRVPCGNEPLSENENPSRASHVPGSVSFVPSVAGLIIAGEVVKELIR